MAFVPFGLALFFMPKKGTERHGIAYQVSPPRPVLLPLPQPRRLTFCAFVVVVAVVVVVVDDLNWGGGS